MKISENFYRAFDPTFVASFHKNSDDKKKSCKKLKRLLDKSESLVLLENDIKSIWGCLMVERWCKVYSTMELIYRRLTLYERVIGKDFIIMKEITRWCKEEFQSDFFGYMRIVMRNFFPDNESGTTMPSSDPPKNFLEQFYSNLLKDSSPKQAFRMMVRILALSKLNEHYHGTSTNTNKEILSKISEIKKILRSADPLPPTHNLAREVIHLFSNSIKVDVKIYKLVKNKLVKEVVEHFESSGEEMGKKKIIPKHRAVFRILEINGFIYLVNKKKSEAMTSDHKTKLETEVRIMTLEVEEDVRDITKPSIVGSLIRPSETEMIIEDLTKNKEELKEVVLGGQCKICKIILNHFTVSPFKATCRSCYIKHTCDLCYSMLESSYFVNNNCFHRFCEVCVKKLVETHKEILINLILDDKRISCIAKKCKSIINLKDLDRFYDGQLYTSLFKSKNFDTICSVCKKKDKLPSNSKDLIEYHACKSCKAVTCLYHEKPMSECLCICSICLTRFKQETVGFQNLLKCQKCNDILCRNCKMRIKDKNAYCKCKCVTCYELLVIESPSGEPAKCENCNKICDSCFVDYKFGLCRFCKMCGKGFCKCCILTKSQDWEKLKKNSQMKESKQKGEKMENILTTAKKIDRSNFCIYCK